MNPVQPKQIEMEPKSNTNPKHTSRLRIYTISVESCNNNEIQQTNIGNESEQKLPPSSSITLPHPTSNVEVKVSPKHDSKDYDENIIKAMMSMQKSSNSKLYPVKIFLYNEYFYARITFIGVTIFLLLLSILYAIGNLLSLNLANYGCPKKTAEEIKEHSINNALQTGDADGCWRTKGFTVHKEALWSTQSHSYKVNYAPDAILKCIAFITVAILFLSLSLLYIRVLLYDIKRYRVYGRFTRNSMVPHKHKPTMSRIRSFSDSIESFSRNRCCVFIRSFLNIFVTDSGPWILKTMIKEMIEIGVQTLALLYYNGYYITHNHDDDVILAQNPKFIILFAIFISLNCILTGLLWFFYCIRPLLCHGLLFHGLLYSIDAVFDIFYAIYPLIIVLEYNSDIMTALASLNTDEGIQFWIIWTPILFLCWSSFFLSRKMRKAMSAAMRLKKLETETKELASSSSNSSQSPLHLISQNARKLITSSNYVVSSSSNRKNLIRKISVFLAAICFGIYGIFILSFVVTHFNDSKLYCKSVIIETNKFAETLIYNTTNINTFKFDDTVQQRINKYPELMLWDECKFKVYPFTKSNEYAPCQCRQFETNWDNFIWTADELRQYFNIELIDILGNILNKWYMLEKLRWEGTDKMYSPNDPPKYSLTADMFKAKRMRVFKLSTTPIQYIDDAISNFKLLGYFSFTANEPLTEFPISLGKLSNLKYLGISDLWTMSEFPAQICNLTQLETIQVELTSITTIPHCVSNMNHLKSVLFTSNPKLIGFPLDLLNIDTLEELSVVGGVCTWSTLMEFNGIENITEFDKTFEWNNKASYWSQLQNFCDNMNNISSSKFKQWIDETDCCGESCNFGNTLNAVVCPSYSWQNGVCDESCNIGPCKYDGGDCLQLCQCDYELLGNGQCDIACNNTQCQFDMKDCLLTGLNEANALTQCKLGYERNIHQCQPDWVNDGFCDSQCQFNDLCGNDGDDCNDCIDNQCWNAFVFFNMGANSITHDNHISDKEVCIMWSAGLATGLFDELIAIQPELINCSNTIPMFDRNNDKQINMYETIVALRFLFNISEQKALQINCSMCVGTVDYVN